MNAQHYTPTESLSSFVKTYLIIETKEEQVNRVFPDTSLVMAFRYKGHVSYLSNDSKNDLAPTVISGLRKSGRLINYSKDTANLLVIFTEAGANAFIKEPIYELTETSISVKDLTNYKDTSYIEEQLEAAPDNARRIKIIEQFLLSKLSNHKADKLILAALDRIHLTKGIIRIKDLADALCISQDAFEKRFRRVVGMTAKQFSYIIRMRRIISNGLKKQSLAEVAFNAGYFDQPHFNKDFKLFTGLTPTDFLKSPIFW